MTTFKIIAPQQKTWDAQHGVWNPLLPYSSDAPIWGVEIKNGEGQTDDPIVAVEFCDMRYTVEPDPHAEAQAVAKEREREAELDAAKSKIERVKIKAEAQRQVAGLLTEDERRLLGQAEAEEQEAEASLSDFVEAEPEADETPERGGGKTRR